MDLVSVIERMVGELVSWGVAALTATGGLLVTIALLAVVASYELGMAAGNQWVVNHQLSLLAVIIPLSVIFCGLVVFESLIVLGML